VGTSKITGGQVSHNKPIGCGASGAYASGADDKEGLSSGLHYEPWDPKDVRSYLTLIGSSI